MKDWGKRRQDSLAELTLSAHILAYLVATIILIAGTPIEQYSLNSYTLLLVVIMLPATLFILLDSQFMQRRLGRWVKLLWNLAKHTLLLTVITVVLSTFQGEQLWLFSSIYLIPVLLSCINLGKWWGTAFAGAAVGSLFWLSRGTSIAGNQVVAPLEAALVLGSIIFLLAWLLGSIIEVEKGTTEQMQQERDLIARMMETNPAGIIVLDGQRNLIYANARIEEILGLGKNELQENFFRRTSVKNLDCIEEVCHHVLSAGEPIYNYQGTVAGTDEKLIYLSVSGAPIFNSTNHLEQVVLTVDDITTQKKITEEMLKANKLESLGLLAGGIAHDFNNFLTIMLGNISLIKIKHENQKIGENLEHIEKAVMQARELTRKLSIFARGGLPVKKVVHLPRLLYDTAGFALSGSEVIYEVEVEDELFPVEIDETQIGQVINNILINAVQAMPTGGKVGLLASNLTIDDESNKSGLPLTRGGYVCIKISDEGTGIPADLLDKIFDPFFSTKTHGSGLGLATSYTIIKNHGGLIQVESQPGVGTNFYIYLPVSKESCFIYPEDEGKIYFGKGRILIMDDDRLILNVCGNMLQYLGYCVSCAQDGAEAVRLYREAAKAGPGSAFDAVIMDLTIPGGIGGKDAVNLLRQVDPEVKAIASTGYYDTPVIANYKDYGFSGFVSKPYQIKELSEAIKKVI